MIAVVEEEEEVEVVEERGEEGLVVCVATWTGLQRGSSMSRFLLADSFSVTLARSSVLPFCTRTRQRNKRYLIPTPGVVSRSIVEKSIVTFFF